MKKYGISTDSGAVGVDSLYSFISQVSSDFHDKEDAPDKRYIDNASIAINIGKKRVS